MKLNPKLFIDVIFPVGTSYITNNPSFNPNTAWGGTWVKDCEGQTIVGQKANDSDFGTLDDVVGEKTHTLTIDEMPSHNHDQINLASNYLTAWNSKTGDKSIFDLSNLSNGQGTAQGTGVQNNFGTSFNGGNQAHNNIQPSKVKIIWT